MKKIFFSTITILMSLQLTFGQNTTSFFIEGGLDVTSFQDEKFSDVIYNGAGFVLNLGFQREKPRSISTGGLNVNFSSESAATHEKGSGIMLHPRFYYSYARKINQKLAVGVHWDILGLYYRTTDGLMNNGNYYLSSSDLMLAGKYQLGKFRVGADIGLISLIKEGTGFAFSAPQNGLEDGEFNYQNEALENPFGFQYGTIRGIGKHFKIRTNVQWQLNNKLAFGYQWEMRRFSEVKDRPVTTGMHIVTVRFNLIHKEKEADNRF